MESLAEGGGSEIQRVKEDARKKVQQVEELLTKRIHLLEEVSLEMSRVSLRESVRTFFSPLNVVFKQKCSHFCFLDSNLSVGTWCMHLIALTMLSSFP